MSEPTLEELFGPVISRYTRAQAIADGVLHDLTEWGREARFCVPVACTASVWAMIEAIPEGLKGQQDVRGRAHDLLCMARWGAEAAPQGADRVGFSVLMNVAGTRQRRHTLTVHVGPGDRGECVVTIMQPGEA